MENGIFKRSGKQSVLVKWQKNFFRFCCVVFCAALSYFGAADLDKFVSFVGSFAWYVILLVPSLFVSCACRILLRLCSVPLCYVYPPMLHYKACARTRKQKMADIALMIFGTATAVYTMVQTVRVRVC